MLQSSRLNMNVCHIVKQVEEKGERSEFAIVKDLFHNITPTTIIEFL